MRWAIFLKSESVKDNYKTYLKSARTIRTYNFYVVDDGDALLICKPPLGNLISLKELRTGVRKETDIKDLPFLDVPQQNSTI